MNGKYKNTLSELPPLIFTGITLLAILWLTLSPRPFGSMETPFFPGADKIVHGLMFGFFTAMMALDKRRKNHFRPLPFYTLIIFALLSSLLGVAIEYLQEALHTGRAFENADMAADTIGAFAFAIGLYIFQSKHQEK